MLLAGCCSYRCATLSTALLLLQRLDRRCKLHSVLLAQHKQTGSCRELQRMSMRLYVVNSGCRGARSWGIDEIASFRRKPSGGSVGSLCVLPEARPFT